MGVVGAIVGTLAMGYFQGKAQQEQYEAMAAQADANRKIEEANAMKADEAAKQQDQVNKINEENERRKQLLMMGQQRAAIGASGITATGSALNALQDTYTNINTDAGILSYNNRQKTQQLFDQSTEHTQQGLMYGNQADSYRSAGRSAMKNAMLGAVFSAVTPLAGSLYSSNSAAKVGTATASGSGIGNIAPSKGPWSATSKRIGAFGSPY